MAAVRVFLCIICAIAFSGHRCIGSGNVRISAGAAKLLEVARSQLYVREATGKNDGVEVEGYLKYVGFGKGYAWCAAFISFCFWKAGYSAPRTAWSPALFPASRLVKGPHAGTVYGIYFNDLGRVGHCGLVERMQGDWCQGIEGNTNLEGSREGQGIFRKLRHKRTIRAFAKWD